MPPGLASALAPGTVIGGKYRVERIVGTGGMGVVVAARHLELNQVLAIKVLLPSAAKSQEATTRFLREGRSAAQLTSPHVAKVHDTGRLPSGEPYLVMELLRGRDLRDHLEAVGRVPLAQATAWILEATHVLAEAHALHIVHRDIKPANLFLAETSGGPVIKVLDFGISKHLDSAEAALTNTASIVGTPRYMAPEQMRSARLADARCDIWSLGVVLYELTTGQPPFHGDSVTALCFDVMERTPIMPSRIDPSLPPSFDAVIDLCLRKDPDERFQSVDALAAALRALGPESRASVSGSTPIPHVSTPDPAVATRPDLPLPSSALAPPVAATSLLPRPVFPEIPAHETMRSWNTSPASAPSVKKGPRMLLVALGVGIGVAVATPVVMLMTKREPIPAEGPSAPATISAAAPSVSIAPSESSTTVALPPPTMVAISSESASESVAPPEPPVASASVAKTKALRPSCNPPYTTDERGHRHAKPQCL